MKGKPNSAMLEGMVWGAGGKFLLMLVNLATLMVTSRILGAAEFGIYAMALIFADFSIGFANSTIGTAIVTGKGLKEEDLKAGFAAFLLTALVLAGVFHLGSGLLSQLVGLPEMAHVLSAISLLLPLRLLSCYLGSCLMREMRLKTHQISQSFPQMFGALTTIAAVVAGAGVWGLVIGVLASGLVEFLYLLRCSRAPMRFPSSTYPVFALFRTGASLSSARIISFMASNVDRIIISRQLGADALGYYTRAFGLMMVPFKVFGVTFGRVFLSAFSKMEPDSPEFSALMSRVLALQGLIYVPVSIGLVASADTLVRIVLGSDWLSIVDITQVLFVTMFARMGYETCEAVLLAAGRPWIVTQRQLLLLVLLTVFCLCGFYLRGLTGVSIGVSAALILYYFLSIIQLVRLFNGSGKSILTAHVMGGIVALTAAASAAALFWMYFQILAPETPNQSVIWATFYWISFSILLLVLPDTWCGTNISENRNQVLRLLNRRKKKEVDDGF